MLTLDLQVLATTKAPQGYPRAAPDSDQSQLRRSTLVVRNAGTDGAFGNIVGHAKNVEICRLFGGPDSNSTSLDWMTVASLGSSGRTS